MEIPNTEQPKSAKEGGLEAGIQKMRESIDSLTSVVDQIGRLQRVPAGYNNLAGEGKVDMRELPALDQWVDKRAQYDEQFKRTDEKLQETYIEILNLLDVLRRVTGISSREETMKFDKDTGRQEKDKE
ncbi:MAG: hypothetical protein Q7S84_04015 [bacterium]|nr:hypothetical protein [bacterium]